MCFKTIVRSFEVPSSIVSIESSAFNLCFSLEIFTFGPLPIVQSIGARAFYGTSIRSIVFPDSLLSIRDMAFAKCRHLTEVTFGNSLSRIGSEAFRGSAISQVIFPIHWKKSIGLLL
jgi:hypothetical protein